MEAGPVPQQELLPDAARTAACAYLSFTTSLMFSLSIEPPACFAISLKPCYIDGAAFSTTTVLHQIVHQAIYVLKVGGVGDRPSVSVRFNKFCRCQNIQVKRKSWSRKFEAASDFACWKALGSILDEQTKNI